MSSKSPSASHLKTWKKTDLASPVIQMKQ